MLLTTDGLSRGAAALLARNLGVRGSLDVDVYRTVARELAEFDVRRAADVDLHDWFEFEIGTSAPIGNNGVRLPVTAVIGPTTWLNFHLDLSGNDLRMTGHQEDVPPVARGIILDVEQRGYRAYPLVDHVADKVAATYERHGEMRHPSTRYRDLVDLIAMASGATFRAELQLEALRSEFARRQIEVPMTFDVPDRELWKRGYEAEVQRSILEGIQTLDEALAVVRGFLDPLFQGRCAGKWNPDTLTWND